VTGRHAGALLPSDSWLVDQWTTWARDVDAYFDQCDDDQTRSASLTHEQVWSKLMDQSARKTALLCTARFLAAEALRRDGIHG
jgi:hypothetical protein